MRGDELLERWNDIRRLRSDATEAIEPMRREKIVGSSLEVAFTVFRDAKDDLPIERGELAELLIVSAVSFESGNAPEGAHFLHHSNGDVLEQTKFTVTKTTNHKCGRCWRHLPEVTEDGTLCGRCDTVLNA